MHFSISIGKPVRLRLFKHVSKEVGVFKSSKQEHALMCDGLILLTDLLARINLQEI